MSLTQVPNDAIADASVTTQKLADSSVTSSKIADGSVSTAELTDGGVTPEKLAQPLTQSTAQATTSGTVKDFTNIPSWVKRITITLQNVSTNGTSHKLLRIGNGGALATSGYSSNCAIYSTGTIMASSSAGFIIFTAAATDALNAVCQLVHMGGNLWVFSHVGHIGISFTANGGGSLQLSGPLDAIRLTTVNGTDVFDAGSMNILYE